MRLNQAVKKTLLPRFKAKGYSYDLDYGEHIFDSPDKDHYISIRWRPRYNKDLEIIVDKLVVFGMRFDLESFTAEFFPLANATYHNQTELEDYLEKVGAFIDDTLLAYINIQAKNRIFPTRAQYRQLESNPHGLASELIEQYQLHDEDSINNCARLDNLIRSLRGELHERQQTLLENVDLVIKMAAYLGVLTNQKYGTPNMWKWREEHNYLSVGHQGLDVLAAVFYAWLFIDETKYAPLTT